MRTEISDKREALPVEVLPQSQVNEHWKLPWLSRYGIPKGIGGKLSIYHQPEGLRVLGILYLYEEEHARGRGRRAHGGRGRLLAVCAIREPAPLPSYRPCANIHQHPPSSANKLLASAIMSHTNPIATSSSNFQQVFSNALEEYERYTKQDLLAHPLAAQLQACESPNSILLVLQQRLQGPNRSQNIDDRLTKCLVPTVNVLYAFSATLGERVGLVCFRKRTCDICIIKCI